LFWLWQCTEFFVICWKIGGNEVCPSLPKTYSFVGSRRRDSKVDCVLLCGSSGADVTAESNSSWTTRSLMETQYNTIQSNNNNNNYTIQKKSKECVNTDTIFHQQLETELKQKYQQSFPNSTHQCCSQIVFVPRTNQSNRASEKINDFAHTPPTVWPPRHRKITIPGGPLTTTRLFANISYRGQTKQSNEHNQRAHLTDDRRGPSESQRKYLNI
jgi:hypothetical protein